MENKQKDKQLSYITILMPDNTKIKLCNYDTYNERMQEIINNIPYISNYPMQNRLGKENVNKMINTILLNYFEIYWFGKKSMNGSFSEKVKVCLDCITTYLLRAEDSGIEQVVIH